MDVQFDATEQLVGEQRLKRVAIGVAIVIVVQLASSVLSYHLFSITSLVTAGIAIGAVSHADGLIATVAESAVAGGVVTAGFSVQLGISKVSVATFLTTPDAYVTFAFFFAVGSVTTGLGSGIGLLLAEAVRAVLADGDEETG